MVSVSTRCLGSYHNENRRPLGTEQVEFQFLYNPKGCLIRNATFVLLNFDKHMAAWTKWKLVKILKRQQTHMRCMHEIYAYLYFTRSKCCCMHGEFKNCPTRECLGSAWIGNNVSKNYKGPGFFCLWVNKKSWIKLQGSGQTGVRTVFLVCACNFGKKMTIKGKEMEAPIDYSIGFQFFCFIYYVVY